ncbi:MAG: hypothetical protein M1142_04110 [Patescibacteria group bacterium]|nr:hypothetical protein [Patescibacteria group bacterium]
MAERKFSTSEVELFHILRTDPKEIKSRQLVRDPNTTPRGEWPFEIVHRQGAVLNFPSVPNEFYLVSHEKAWREGRPLTGPSGIYWDFRKPNNLLLDAMGKVLAQVPLEDDPKYVAGIPTTGGKIASAYARYSPKVANLELFQKVDTSGGSTTITVAENAPRGHGEPVIIVDDVLSKGTSATPAFEVVKAQGFEPIGLLVVIDRQQGGVARLNAAGHKVYAWCNVEEALDYYLNQAPSKIRIKQSEYSAALESLRQDQYSG